jgi:hypothetical protein
MFGLAQLLVPLKPIPLLLLNSLVQEELELLVKVVK